MKLEDGPANTTDRLLQQPRKDGCPVMVKPPKEDRPGEVRYGHQTLAPSTPALGAKVVELMTSGGRAGRTRSHIGLNPSIPLALLSSPTPVKLVCRLCGLRAAWAEKQLSELSRLTLRVFKAKINGP